MNYTIIVINSSSNFITMALLVQKPPDDVKECKSVVRSADESAVQLVSQILSSLSDPKHQRFIDLGSVLRWYEEEGFRYLDFELANMVSVSDCFGLLNR